MVRRHVLSKKERRKFLAELKARYPGLEVDRKSVVEVVEDRELGSIFIIDGIPAFIVLQGEYIPHLRFLLARGYEWIPYVVVDEGAVKPLLRGADVMVPGIRRIVGSFSRGDIVVVVEEKYSKPFVVGRALLDSGEIGTSVSRGKAVENIHRVGDRYWKFKL